MSVAFSPTPDGGKMLFRLCCSVFCCGVRLTQNRGEVARQSRAGGKRGEQQSLSASEKGESNRGRAAAVCLQLHGALAPVNSHHHDFLFFSFDLYDFDFDYE